MSSKDVPARDEATAVEPAEPLENVETAEAEEEKPTETAPPKNWRENFSVKETEEIETVDRLKIITGVNEYKGNFLVFLAKVTDKEFSRQFFSMPAYVWQKALPKIQAMAMKIAEVEKKAMADAVKTELKRLKELGIDVGALVKEV